MNLIELLFDQIPEAVYFALFLIFTKSIKEKRFLFVLLMISEYILLKSFIHFNVWFQVGYIGLTFLTLKFLYKNRAQVTDIFTFGIASIVMMVISGIFYVLTYYTFQNIFICNILTKICLFVLLFLFHKKLCIIDKVYSKLWNRNDKLHKPIKSTTFRCINVVLFNIMFYIINVVMVYSLVRNGGV